MVKQINKDSSLAQLHCKEAGLLKNLNHPGIPSIIDVEEDNDYIYMIQEYKEGISFRQMLDEHRLSEELYLDIFIELANLLSWLHEEAQVVHSDIKPENVIISGKNVALIDFESAALNADFAYTTPGYSAPEEAEGKKADEKTDIYAFGCMMKEALLSTDRITGESEAKLLKLAGECMSDRRACRIRSIRDAGNVLKKIKSAKNIKSLNDPSRTVTVAGTAQNAGTTFVSLMLGRMLGEKGYKTLYLEQNESGMVKTAANAAETTDFSERTYFLFGNELVPRGWESFIDCQAMERYGKLISDLGRLTKENVVDFLRGSVRILVAGGSEWEINELIAGLRILEDAKNEGQVICLLNLSEKKHVSRVQNVLKEERMIEHIKLLAMPYISEHIASKNDRKTRKMLEELLNETL